MGLVASTTVTVAEQVAVQLLLSVTVNVTVLGPTLAQVKEVAESDMLAMPQLSEEPLFTWAAVTLALLPLRFTDTFWQIAVGLVASTTVTVAEQVDVRLLLSVTVRVTVFGPTFVQMKEVVDKTVLAMPQLSEEPLFTCAAVTLALLPFRFTDTF